MKKKTRKTRWVVDRESGLTVNPRNPGELAAAIESLLGDERMRLILGAAGRRRVLEMFDQQKQWTKYLWLKEFLNDYGGEG